MVSGALPHRVQKIHDRYGEVVKLPQMSFPLRTQLRGETSTQEISIALVVIRLGQRCWLRGERSFVEKWVERNPGGSITPCDILIRLNTHYTADPYTSSISQQKKEIFIMYCL